jgi:protocatechuate 3,4-dioxygenase beta subunit
MRVDLAVQRDVVLVLERTAVVRGRVVTAAGAPVPGAQVVAVPDAPDAGAIAGTLADIADRDGRFELRGLATTPHVVRAAAPGARDRTLASHSGVRITPGSDGELRVVVGAGAVAGTIRFDDGTVPARFTVALPWSEPAAFASPDGRFTVRDLSVGTYALAIAGAGFVNEQRSGVEVRTGETTELGTIVVRRGARVRGRVVDPSGTPVDGATVLVGRTLLGTRARLDTAGMFEAFGGRHAITSADGTFAVEIANTEDVAIVAERPDLGRSILAEVTGTAPIELVLERTGTLVGRVLRGTAGAAATVTAQPLGPVTVHLAVTADDDGRYRFDTLAPGEYRIAAEYHGARVTARAVVASGRTATRDLAIAAGAEVSVKIAAALALDSVLITLVRGDHPLGSPAELAALDEDDVWTQLVVRIPGRAMRDAAHFADIPSGTYTACVTRPSRNAGPIACRTLHVDGDRPVAITLTL